MQRSRQLVDRLVTEAVGPSARTRPPLRIVTASVNQALQQAGLGQVGQRAVDLRLKAIFGAKWARRPRA